MPLSWGEICPFLQKLPKIGEFHCNVPLRLVYMLTIMWSGCKVDWVALNLNLPVSEEDSQVPNGSECLYLYTQFSVGWRRSCSMHWTWHCQCQVCVFACFCFCICICICVTNMLSGAVCIELDIGNVGGVRRRFLHCTKCTVLSALHKLTQIHQIQKDSIYTIGIWKDKHGCIEQLWRFARCVKIK